MTDQLCLVADGRIMGAIRRNGGGRLTLAYAPAWRSLDGAWPLSLSMPLVVAEHEHGRIEPWLRRLLPDDDRVLERWGRRFNVAPRDPFGLLAAVGEDCAGAVQFAPAEQLGALSQGKAMAIDWLTRSSMAERLRALRKDPAAWRQARDAGRCSLGGARPKTALFFNGQHWGVPSGRTPTTHILIPPTEGATDDATTAQLCLDLARTLGLPAARSQMVVFEDQTALAVERFDRVRDGSGIRRLHQEDFSQALGLAARPPRDLPVARVAEALRAYSSAPRDDVWTLARALLLRWLIGAPAATLRDLSILIGAAGQVRLAPLRNVSSTLLEDRRNSEAGAEPESAASARRRWQRIAADARLPASALLAAGRDMAAAIPEALRSLTARMVAHGAVPPAAVRLAELLSARAAHCHDLLAA